MPDATELIKLIKKCALDAVEASKPTHFLYGTVTKVDPLQIDVDQKLKIGAAHLLLARNVTDYETEVSVDAVTEGTLGRHTHDLNIQIEEALEPQHTHQAVAKAEQVDLKHSHRLKGRMKVTVHNRLKLGDKVILLQNKGGGKYLVVDRI